MKRFFYLLVIPLLLVGCQEMTAELDDIKSRLAALEGSSITSIQEQITLIKTSIKALEDAKASLEGKDDELEDMIEQLQTYIDESLSQATDWVAATYCTLEQYMELADEVAALKESLTTEEGGSKLTELENSLKSWVGEALTGYYDIATLDAKLALLATQESVKTDIDQVKSDLNQVKSDLTTAYKNAISEAIETNNGVINTKIATEIGNVQTYVDNQLAALNGKIDGLEKRIKALEDLTAGLKVSDAVFGFVLYTQADTVTKGLKFPVTFRVNPSGVPFTKDMVVLDNMANTKYLVMEENDTKASYITESKNFYVDSLGNSRNAANEEMQGQYFVRLGNKETRNLIDDNYFALVGAYRDKDSVVQYVSTSPFKVVMMPTPAEGLYPWMYAHGGVTRMKEVTIPESKALVGSTWMGNVKGVDYELTFTSGTEFTITGNAKQYKGVYVINSTNASLTGSEITLTPVGEWIDENANDVGQFESESKIVFKDFVLIRKATEAKTRYVQELGVICFALDSRNYKQENGDGRQTYSAKKYLRSISFEPATAADSLVICAPVRDSGFVRFIPDTSKAQMRALMDTTKLGSVTVKGKIIAVDRFGGSSAFPVEMTWHSDCRDTLTVEKKVSDFFTINEQQEEVRKGVLVDLEEEFKKLGYFPYELGTARRKLHQHFIGSSPRFLLTDDPEAPSEERKTVTTVIRSVGPKDKLPGTYFLRTGNTINVNPTLEDATFQEGQLSAYITIKLVVTE